MLNKNKTYKLNCPACGKTIEYNTKIASEQIKENPSFPFCSSRCQMLDLNSWLETDYRIPVKSQISDEIV